MDVKTLVETKARAARAAAPRAGPVLHPHEERGAARRWRGGWRRRPAAILDANRADLERARATGRAARLPRPAHPHRRAHRGDGGRAARDRRAARPGGRDGGGRAPAQRRSRSPGARAARGHRLHLRVAPQRHRGRRRALREVGQRGACCAAAARRIESNALIAAGAGQGAREGGPPADAIQFVEITDRAAVAAMLEQDALIDLIIPRGGEAFVRWVAERSRVPVLKHDKGLVHVFVDAAADLDMAHDASCINAKTQRPSVCNALETLLVDRAVRRRFLPMVGRPAGRGRRRAARLTRDAGPRAGRACPPRAADWDEEYLDLILAMRVVDDLDAAVDAHPPSRHRAGRGHRHQRPRPRPPLHARGGRRRGAGQRLHAAGRRQPVRPRRRDGHLDLTRPRARPGGRARADDDQVHRAGRRAGPGLSVGPRRRVRRVLQPDPSTGICCWPTRSSRSLGARPGAASCRPRRRRTSRRPSWRRRPTASRWCSSPSPATRGFAVSDLELRRPGPSYSVDTLTELAAGGDELFFVIGSETFLDLLSWREPRRIAAPGPARRDPARG